MSKTVIKVDGMACEHCVKAITNAVGALSGVSGVSVDLSGKTVTVDHDPDQASVEAIQSEIEDQGYDVME
ncbi:copper ion binding protein [Lacrimispora saccharolytica]|uniref:Copper ion binding protein n=1 Tax=Lacrimispora saccharolytica (strain ATCC 35040 / DSM 2544 / NRCC 2533 / WM1) TaxID=610130 RepID=D9R536_LACSW|nr:copper ion binding protein [Lacrimispora saccharolytica]ADL05143.1 copper ion binding protein [[Clostridium] saccharolyticum WM1]QRV20672.1 heavy-metal-associated domain-containing protein [Lacrimispora saccharolytica]